MTQPARIVSRLWFPLAVGLAAVCGLLLTIRPITVASPPQEQPTDAFTLWLLPPETSPAPGPWPLAVEAHQAGWLARGAVVERRLAALKAEGRVATFEPLPDGIGFTVAAPAGLPPEVHRWPEVVRVTLPGEATPELLATWWWQGLDVAATVRAAPLSAQQVTTLTLSLGLHNHLVSGSTPRPEPVALSLTRDGEAIASNTATPFPDGSGGYLYAVTLYGTYYGCGGDGGGGGYCYPSIEPGDVLQAAQAGQTFSLTVPLLTALADQDTATVYGQAPPSTTLEVYFYRYGNPCVAYQQTVTAAATGDYQADFGSLALVTPRDYGYVFYAPENENEAGDHVYARYNVPFLRVGVKDDYADGVVAPCTTVTATLHDHTGVLRELDYGFSSSDGAFGVYFYSSLQVGDTIVITAAGQVVSMTVPALTARPDPTSDVIGGEAPPGAAVQVDLYRGPLECGYYPSCPPYGDPDYSLSVTAVLTGTLAGTYAADFTGLADVVAGDYGVVYVTNAAGHQVYRCFAVPFLRAHPGDYYWLTGQVNGSGPVTITVQGNSGIPREVRPAWAYGLGYFDDYGGESKLRLLTGDQVTVTTEGGEETGLTVPLLTTYAERVNSIVHGQAPPGSLLRVGLSHADVYLAGGGPPYYPSYEHTLWVTSTAGGVYTADFSSLTTMEPRDYGAVFYVNPEGHELYLEFTVPAVPAVPVVRVQSGSNYVTGALPVESGQIIVTLRGASGQVKATATTWSCYDGSFDVYLYQDEQWAIIEAGDTVEVAAGDTLVTVAVPTLTVQADWTADSLFGQALPDAPLKVTWYGGDDWDEPSRTWVVTSTIAGSYSLDLSGQVDLERGDQIKVTWTDENDNEVWVSYRAPRLEAALGSSDVNLVGPLYSPLTLTLLSIDGALLYTGTTTLDASGQAWFYLYDPDSGIPLYQETGQTLVADLAGEVMTLTLPHLTARADPLADTVSGEAPPGARLVVYAASWWDWSSVAATITGDGDAGGGGWWDWLPVTVTITGTYSVDFSDVVDFGSSSGGEVVYLHPDGHRVTLGYAVPHIEVALGEPYVNGVAPGPGVVTVTLRDEGGDFKGSGVDTNWCDWLYVYLTDAQQEPVPVAGGDVLVVEAAGSVMTFAVPALAASFDQRTGILTGTAPAGVWLRVFLGGGSRQVRAGSDGTCAMDWSDLSPRSGEQGSLEYADDLGNRTRLYFTVPYYDLYLPLVYRGG